MGVIIGMDPHKRSATIEIINEQATVLAAQPKRSPQRALT